MNYIVKLPSGGLELFHVTLLEVWMEDYGMKVAFGEKWNWSTVGDEPGAEEHWGQSR